MQVRSSDVNAFWLDARHLMNELADGLGAAIVVAAPGGAGFVVLAGEDLIVCEREAGRGEILDSRIGG